MNSDTAIKISHLSKKYSIGKQKEDSLLSSLGNLFRNSISKGDDFWALKDVSFEINKGDIIGIIGENGAGKSTLLKILSQITKPTEGLIEINGRIASLLEVGTGFHPELSGRENIFLNGTILGMTRQEVKNKFDEIVAFSGVEKFIDTPVKHYSSGMYVRLAFAVAAHLEPEILIIDEVLAVGDAEFQKKCMGKMKEVSENDGRTIIFVSHNMTAMKSLCNRGVYLKKGKVELISSIDNAIKEYLKSDEMSSFKEINFSNEKLKINTISFQDNGIYGNFDINKPLIINVAFEILILKEPLNINLFFKTLDGLLIFATCSTAEILESGEYNIQCEIPANTLNDNDYAIDLMAVVNLEKPIFFKENIINIRGMEPKRKGAWLDKYPGLIRPEYFNWNLMKQI